jgi:pentatricopeptide repeat protein
VPEVYGMLIQAYYDTQRYQQAWEYLRHAQSLGFEFPQLLTALQKVKDQQPRR